MGRSKRKHQANNESKRGHYKRDHDYVDYSDIEANDMYEDDHISIASSSEGEYVSSDSASDSISNKEEDFISLGTEVVDERSRQQRRFEERADLKRKRKEDEDTSWESDVCYPWMELMGNNRLKQPVSASRLLQREVSCLLQYLEPTKIEIRLREYLVHRIRSVIQEKWPGSKVDVFGSFSTQLYLPNSDIDLVVRIPPSTKVRLRRIASCLEQEDICRDPQVIEGASVPVIKFEDIMTKLKVDIILDSTSGIDSATAIQGMLKKYPGLRPLSLIVKYLLMLRNQNEVFTGGLGGYAVVCLVVSFLQMHPKVASGQIDPMQNLGVLLLDFFQLYGLNFNLDYVGINVKGTGSYYDKSHVVCRNGKAVFSITDPQDSHNDIGMKSYNSGSIIRSFKYAYLAMTRKAFQLQEELRSNNYTQLDRSTLESPKRASILGSFLHISADFMKQRELMNTVYEEKRWDDQAAASSFNFE
ncbi:uncharacterized protein EV154DRAFT_498110 [Mucor mucedo]|uniref:uncharacterized protein n=1 Tax=Mucor mucedo TaxID=29922 RepID=UPI002220A949|nr:uncharacterized protein EV154DRAFT_498110 [Mucor mucedo]KAI7894537.1 hypothetical protein EV154DRAFT_498110 [Mucor mucedo]